MTIGGNLTQASNVLLSIAAVTNTAAFMFTGSFLALVLAASFSIAVMYTWPDADVPHG